MFVTVGTAEGPQDFVYSQPEWGNATFASNPLQIDYGSWMHLMVVVRSGGASFYKNGFINRRRNPRLLSTSVLR